MTAIQTAPAPTLHFRPTPAEEHEPLRARRIFSPANPGAAGHPVQPGLWPARWIGLDERLQIAPLVAAYRLKFSLSTSETIRFHITADERYEFFVDGESIGCGSERGDADNWFYESYEVKLLTGAHTLVARVWSLGEKAPLAQMSLGHGFFLCADEAHLALSTGMGDWEAKLLPGYEWTPPLSCTWSTGWNQVIDGREFHWDHDQGQGDGWQPARMGAFGDSADGVRNISVQKSTTRYHRLQPATLPPMRDEPVPVGRVRHVGEIQTEPAGLTPIQAADSLARETTAWQRLLAQHQPLVIPPFTKRRVIIDLDDYFCARPVLGVSGGRDATVAIDWTESLYQNIDRPDANRDIESHVWPKGNRDEIEGKFFICPWFLQDGPGDKFIMDGGDGRSYSTLWWQAGRYIQILVTTGRDELQIDSLEFRETRYPLEMEGTISCSDERLTNLIPLMVRGLQACSHETYMDCPFYEQLMYVGDTRLELLTTYVLTRDDRLPRKALQLFDWSRLFSGLTQSRYPARVRQIIPPFSLWWVASVHDYALWRDDAAFVKSLLPGVREVCDHFAALIGPDGLLNAPDGWNFIDWVKSWDCGAPTPGKNAVSGILNWQATYVFRLASELETWFGEPELSSLQKRRAHTIASAAHQCFWNEARGLYADDAHHTHWSEHAQCMAIISDLVPSDCLPRLGESLLRDPDLARTSIYFTHYLFEAYYKLGQAEHLFARLNLWHSLKKQGLRTTVESPEPSRSDCHAWGAHPLYHIYATLAGIRPAAPGFSSVSVQPISGLPVSLELSLPHPLGEIGFQGDESSFSVALPHNVELSKYVGYQVENQPDRTTKKLTFTKSNRPNS